ncbi:MAG: DegQ family serine endoprotease [Pseudomonadota bacterium]|nr:DegQ family serine endoprotease [Pseudomonadota bacterium]
MIHIRQLSFYAAPILLAAAFGNLQAQSLPDFTGLVDRNAPTVVNISATKTAGAPSNDPSAYRNEEVPEIFRRFFGDPGQFQAPPQERVSGGSGFIISADGYLLTNHHVIDGADEINVRLKDRREFKAKLIGSDQQSDVALLKIAATGLPAATLGDSSKLKPGQWVVAIGSPYNLDFSVTAGIVSAVGRNLGDQQRYVPFIQNDVAINRGNSGGPLFNLSGEVVGINSQIFSNTGGSIGLSFAIPIDYANQVVAQLKSKGKVARGYLGVGLQEVSSNDAAALGLPRVAGALVSQVDKGTPAAKAGLKVQDVILRFEGMPVERSGDLPPLVGGTSPGTRVALGVFRDGRELNVPLVVGELPGATGAAAPNVGSVPETSDAIGLSVSDISADQREQLGVDAGEGVVIERVIGPGARRAGLQTGDVVLMVGRSKVGSVAQFRAAAKAIAKGQPVMLLVRRSGGNRFVTINADE